MYLTVDKKGMISFVEKKKSFLENLLGKIYGDKPTCYLKIHTAAINAGSGLRAPETTVEPLTIVWHNELMPYQCTRSTFPLGRFRLTEWERTNLVHYIRRNMGKVFYTDHYGNVYRCVDVE